MIKQLYGENYLQNQNKRTDVPVKIYPPPITNH